MKIKFLGITVFEIQRDSVPAQNATGSERTTITSGPLRPLARSPTPPSLDLNAPDTILPRTPQGTIDVDASLKAVGVKDPAMLWRHKFKGGTAGGTLKVLLGARGLKPGSPRLDTSRLDLRSYPGSELPLVPGTDRVDTTRALAMFNIHDSSILWKHRFRPGSAGGRLKMLLRAQERSRHLTSARNSLGSVESRAAQVPNAIPAGQSGLAREPDGGASEISHSAPLQALTRGGNGQIDIEASLRVLGITAPIQLWHREVQPGSPEHELKKAIGSALAQRKPVPGITRADIGLSA